MYAMAAIGHGCKGACLLATNDNLDIFDWAAYSQIKGSLCILHMHGVGTAEGYLVVLRFIS